MEDIIYLLVQLPVLDPAAIADYPTAAVFAVLFFGTFVTEDGTCLLAGAMAASGAISFEFAVAACLSGIFVGDMGLYFLGRGFGRSLSKTAVFSRLVTGKRLDRAAAWLEKRGLAAIFISRFVTGLRLPTYLAAGFLRVSAAKFALYFLIAAVVWTPLLVGSAYLAQDVVFGTNFLLGALVLYLTVRLVYALSGRNRRRKFIGGLCRLARWEFWPIQVFYAPVVAYIVWLGFRFRGLTVFTCANPAIPDGGFVGESKHDIYCDLAGSPEAEPHILRHVSFDPASFDPITSSDITSLLDGAGLNFPVVLKPDIGERGRDVRILRAPDQFEEVLADLAGEQILQEYAAGEEFSVFYYRYPDQERGRIFSVTEKEFPVLEGDGRSSIEDLILADKRAVCISTTYLENLEDDPDRVPAEGERVTLIEIGTHARGAIFNDGSRVMTPELESAIDQICKGYSGFYFGRFDLRTSSSERLAQGRDFRIVELNGVTSESTNIYDRKFSLLSAYRTLFRQWRIAFEIGAMNKARGVKQTSASDLLRRYFNAKRPPEAKSPAG